MVTHNDTQQSRSCSCSCSCSCLTTALDTDDAVAPNPRPKRRRCYPSMEPNNADPNRLNALLESFDFHDSSAIAFDLALGRILESKHHDSDKDFVIKRALRLGTALTEAAKRLGKRRASMHNDVVWGLPSELTIKVFSLLDTQSLCLAAAVCSLFNKCAVDPLCYSNINLTTTVPRVNDLVVSTMIQRAGTELQSLKLGTVPWPLGSSHAFDNSVRNSSDTSAFSWNDERSRQGKKTFVLTRSCLTPLAAGVRAPGALLKRLHLYNIEQMDTTAVGAAISACPSLVDLEIIGLNVDLRRTLESVSRSCPLIERLCFESATAGITGSLKCEICYNLVNNCPYLSSLALRGFILVDRKISILFWGLPNLKCVDFSRSIMLTGYFLGDLGCEGYGGSGLEVLILRDCPHLFELEVSMFISSIRNGRLKLLRHLDVSNREGLAVNSDKWLRRCNTLSFTSWPELFEARPNLRVVANFPAEMSEDTESDSSSDSFDEYDYESEGSYYDDEVDDHL